MAKDPGLASRLLIGGIAGFVATMAMTSAMRRLQNKLPKARTSPPPVADPGADRVPDISLAAHFAYGATCGALLAAANPRLSPATGALAGGSIWLASFMGWIPALGGPETASGNALRRNAATFTAHLAWGWSTAKAIDELTDARATIFAAGKGSDRG